MDPQATPEKDSSGSSNRQEIDDRDRPGLVQTSPTDRIRYPSKDGTYFSQLYNQPIVTTLTSFSHVANLVRNPYELINNVDEFVRQASGSGGRKYQRTSDNLTRPHNLDGEPSSQASSSVQEMDTFVAGPLDGSLERTESSRDDRIPQETQLPIPALPPIESSKKRGRLPPLTIDEYEQDYRLRATDKELIDRIFFGSMSCNQLRAALWPYLFGIVIHRGKFEKLKSCDGTEAYIFIEHHANNPRWQELHELYDKYEAQWLAILPDQESRFSSFRERKSLIERDVIRCDRLHLFYADQPDNLAKLTNLLMTYMMYDFDIGYVQGMSDLAGPILYMYQGDLVKSFWVFVEVMKLFRRNFELTQKTIHFQLNCLRELIKITDPIFAQYLEENESSNCFFAFRAIVCQFKRELMKDDEDDYSKVLFLWDTIWCAKRRCQLQQELKNLMKDDLQTTQGDSGDGIDPNRCITEQPSVNTDSPFAITPDPNQADSLRYELTETEIFVLALCLSLIRRERDLIMANNLDSTDIHLHFIDPKLATDVNSFIEHGINIYSYLKSDSFDIKKLTHPQAKTETNRSEQNPESPPSAEGYDLLSDFLIINGASS